LAVTDTSSAGKRLHALEIEAPWSIRQMGLGSLMFDRCLRLRVGTLNMLLLLLLPPLPPSSPPPLLLLLLLLLADTPTLWV
jgi:hypothetical protein